MIFCVVGFYEGIHLRLSGVYYVSSRSGYAPLEVPGPPDPENPSKLYEHAAERYIYALKFQYLYRRLGQEVTKNKKITNNSFSKHPYANWSSEEREWYEGLKV